MDILYKYEDLYAKDDFDIGETDLVELKIPLKEDSKVPVNVHGKRLPINMRNKIIEHILRMEKAGIVRPSTSSWSSPLVPVTKRDGTIRICINYQALNLLTVHNVYPLPNIAEIFDCIGGCNWISIGDIIHGFHNCKVAPQDRDKTAFTVPGLGLYEFVRCPQGIQQMPSLFQNMMDIILAGLKYKIAMGFIDDFIIFSKTFDDHIKHIDIVFGRFRSAGLKFKLKKCHFACKRVEFLGHVITPEGLLVNEAKIQNVRDAKDPTTVTQVQAFLGLTGYYRNFVQDYARVAKPLIDLTQKGMPFLWGQYQKEAFENLRQKLISAPILAYPMMDKPFKLYTDSSRQGHGAVLAQDQEGKERVISYFSKTLGPSEKNYGVTDIEMAAACAAIKKFKHYLQEQPFELITDHLPLKYIFKSTQVTTNRLERLKLGVLLHISKMTVTYKPGKKHLNADALSRFFLPEDPKLDSEKSEKMCRAILFVQAVHAATDELNNEGQEKDPRGEILIELSDKDQKYFETVQRDLGIPEKGLSNQKMKVAQKNDPECAELFEIVKAHKTPAIRELLRTEGNPKIRTPLPEFDLEQGLLVRVDYHWSSGEGRSYSLAIVLPLSLRQEIMKYFHNNPWAGAHQGEARTYSLIARKFWWSGMRKNIIQFCRNCISCATFKAPSKLIRAEMSRLPIVTYPWEGVCSDILGPIQPTVKENKYILTFTDYFTRWTEAFAIKEISAETVLRTFVQEIICRYGCPRFLVTDQGSNYMSELFKIGCKMFGIHHLRTSPYHPQTDGVSERFGRTLVSAIAHFVNQGMTDWDDKIPIIMFALRNTNHSATNEIPYFAMFGRDARMPNIAQLKHPNPRYVDVNDYKTSLLINLRDTWAGVQRELENSFQSSKNYRDKFANTTATDWKVGDKVFVTFPKKPQERLTKKGAKTQVARKFAAKWRGPYRIMKVFHPNVEVLPLFVPHTKARSEIIHVCRLKPFHGEWLPDIESNFSPPHESIQDRVAPTIPEPPTEGASLNVPVAPRVADIPRVVEPKKQNRAKPTTSAELPPMEQILSEAIQNAGGEPKIQKPARKPKKVAEPKIPTPELPIHKLGRPQKYSENQVVWAKYVGYPFWPARIVTSIECPAILLKKLHKPGVVPVYFYGSKNYGAVNENSIRDFDDYFDVAVPKCSTNLFKLSIKDAQADLASGQEL